MKARFHFRDMPHWHTAPCAWWVHVPQPGRPGEFDPPAPTPIPHRGYPWLCVEFESHELHFSALAQLDHFIDVLSRRPLPRSRQLSARRCRTAGPNGHWLSRLPVALKAPRSRERLVRALRSIHGEVAASWPGVRSVPAASLRTHGNPRSTR